MDLELAADHVTFRAAVRELAQGVVQPAAAEVDRDHRFPEEAVKAAAEAGLLGVLIPSEYGGAGLDALAFAICIEEIAQACASSAVIIDVHTSVGSEPILLFGSEEQKRKWLPRLASGEVLGAFALTEPGSGSDAASLKMSARRNGGGYVLNGTKVFITNIGRAGLYVVFARTGEDKTGGISAFLVPSDTPGVRVGQVFKKMGLHGSPTGELVLEDAEVPAENRLGAEGQGFTIAMRALDSGRIGISGQALGIAQAALDESRVLLAGRGREQQGDDFLLAEMAARLESARLLAYHAAWLCSQRRPFTRQASMAKLHCTDTAMQLAIDAVQLAGEEGTISGSPFERHFRDAKALQIYEGSNQVQRIVIARQLLG